MKKSVPAFLAAVLVTGPLAGRMFLVGRDAFSTSTAKAEAAAASTTVPAESMAQYEQIVDQYQSREAQYQAQIDQATEQINTVWTGMGIIAFYLSILVTVTFYMRKRISMKTFRKIHYLSIVAFLGALFHGLYAGIDSALNWTQIMYWGTFLSTVFFGVYWLVTFKLQKREKSNCQIHSQAA